MPLKSKKTHHRTDHDKHGRRRGKKFLKVYAPYIPLLLIVGIGFVVAAQSGLWQTGSRVLGYATQMDSAGLLESANNERVSRGELALKINDKLAAAAQKKADDMAARNYWSHTTPDGQEPWIFIQQSGYNYIQAAENLAYGFSRSEDVTTGWMNSPHHRENLLNGKLAEVGFGIANVADYQNHGPETIVVAMYGEPVPALAATAQTAAPVQTPVSANLAAQAAAALQPPQKITLAQSITKGSAPWINFLVGILLGGAAVYLLSKHVINLRRTLHRGERFILHHPLLDITLVALIALTALLSQTAGVIH